MPGGGISGWSHKNKRRFASWQPVQQYFENTTDRGPVYTSVSVQSIGKNNVKGKDKTKFDFCKMMCSLCN